ncbi:flagellar biosynthesis regulator FlaF [Aquibium carbonis]|uniref:Flagellar biosynthesis regulator FlaF n=1 Tax=Aquibium carbonis TaxID=2495581 RepID=A0A429YW55_9HYPH|nr:flagellar biosynthesis regulator FlaF [Aquibium carbonis]RST85566.1 flagellar biosynthesis regulator FlaF [Aquibium carbonis]
MYQFSYAEIQTDSVADAKDRERQLLSRSIDLLMAARDKGTNSMQAIEALHFLSRVWTTFIEDLASNDNELPSELRANLISIGLWLLREGEAVRQGQSDNFDGLIEVSQIIRDGIQ